jgi:hypothetical protein
MTNSLQAQTKSDKQFQIMSDLNLMTSSLETHTKTLSKLKFGDKNFVLRKSLSHKKHAKVFKHGLFY